MPLALPFFLITAFAYPFARLVRDLVEEKEERIKEGMRIMVGLELTII